MSPSEVHSTVCRAERSRLLHGPQRKNRPNFTALEEFLVHGLKYVFPPERGELTRGVPTSYAAELLRSMITQGNEPVPVWPYEEGKQRGVAFAPLSKTAPIVALCDSCFYEYLALADACETAALGNEKLLRPSYTGGSGIWRSAANAGVPRRQPRRGADASGAPSRDNARRDAARPEDSRVL
jgi:hypothetical protein